MGGPDVAALYLAHYQLSANVGGVMNLRFVTGG